MKDFEASPQEVQDAKIRALAVSYVLSLWPEWSGNRYLPDTAYKHLVALDAFEAGFKKAGESA